MAGEKELAERAEGGQGGKSPSDEVKAWLQEIGYALEREKNFRKEGKETVDIFEGAVRRENSFNILFSNTETLVPALYNTTPRPVVKPRYKKPSAVDTAACQVGVAILEFLIDTNSQQYTSFDDLMKQVVLEAAVPGRGVCEFEYDPTFTHKAETAAEEAEEKTEAGMAEMPAPAEPEYVEYETVCGKPVSWNRFVHGYGKTWEDVSWIAFEYFMTEEEAEKNFGREVAETLKYNITGGVASESEDDESTRNARKLDDAQGTKLVHVWKVWDKDSKSVFFISPSTPDGYLKSEDDPLKLEGFFPIPKPLSFVQKINTLTPKALYKFYEEQAKELNRVSQRINKLIAAMKVRGIYDATLSDLERVMRADDNTLIPAQNVSALQQGQTLEKAIWLMPLQELSSTLQQLYVQREQVKQVIYEIIGMADIMRGTSRASETLGAQELKDKWGGLRLRRMQKAVQFYVRDSLRILLEIAVKHLSLETIQKMSGLSYMTAQQKAQAQEMAMQMQMQGRPEVAQMQAVLAQPAWEEILQTLQDNLSRNFRVDIETNSTVDAESTEDKENIAEFMNAFAQFMNGIAPMVQAGIMPFEAAKAMLLTITQRFRFGREVEEQIKQMQPPAGGKGEDPAAKAEAEAAMQKAQIDMQIAQQEAAAKQQQLELERKIAMLEAQLKEQELMLKQQELAQKAEYNQQKHMMDMQKMANDAVASAAKADLAKKQAKQLQKGDGNANV